MSAPAPPALNATELQAALHRLPGWALDASGTPNAPNAIVRHWRFDDFRQAMVFASAVAELADRLDHHPDLLVGYGRCSVRWSTHDAGGVSARDLDAARQTDAVAARLGACTDGASA